MIELKVKIELNMRVIELNVRSVIDVTRTRLQLYPAPRRCPDLRDTSVPAQIKHHGRVRMEGWAQLGNSDPRGKAKNISWKMHVSVREGNSP